MRESMRVRNLFPQTDGSRCIGLERDRLSQEIHLLVDRVARTRQVGCTPQPEPRLYAQRLELFVGFA